MSVSESFTEPSLFDHSSREPAHKPLPVPTTKVDERAARAETAPANTDTDRAVSGSAATLLDESDRAQPAETPDPPLSAEAIAQNERKRLAEQLEALKRKEFELRRALAAADHPEVAEAIRTIEGRAFAVSRAEAKLAQGFSKSEARRRDVIEKKLGTLREKRAELDSQIGTLESELGGLGADRLATFESERQSALEQLMIAMASHDAALRAAGLDPSNLVPEIARWLPELDALAEKVSGAHASA
jgi:hypothetical protein